MRRDGKSETLSNRIYPENSDEKNKLDSIYKSTAAGIHYLISAIQQVSKYIDEQHLIKLQEKLHHQLQMKMEQSLPLNQPSN